MGFTGELMRSVFSRNRSTHHRHETKVRSNNSGVEKRKWVSVKSYLCGDELNSVLAEEDSASVKSSEETASQPTQEEVLSGEEDQTKSEETVENNNVTENDDSRKNSNSKLLNEEQAAILIQSAYRTFLRRSENEGMRKKPIQEEELRLVIGSPNGKSMGTSIEVQTGNSIEVYPLEAEKSNVCHHRSLHRSRSQVLKEKEDWDDSTVSSYVSKMRMQNRMEATTRRERALAYAFSQQLRICSKRKSNKYESNIAEPNMSWSWLERWMATRLPDTASVESHHDVFSNHRFAVSKRFLDVAREEKESCGSNEVPLRQFDNYSSTSQQVKDHEFIPPAATKAKGNIKGRRTVSRRKTVPSYQFPEEHFKVRKRDGSSGVRKDNRQSRSKRAEVK